MACNSRAVLTARKGAMAPRRATEGAKVKQGGVTPAVEDGDGTLCMEQGTRFSARMQPALGRYFSMTECARHGYAAALSRFGARSVLPGAQPSTYRTKGSSFEHGNLDPSAGQAKSGKPTGLATSRMRGGASVVVRARESRVHGEGRQ